MRKAQWKGDRDCRCPLGVRCNFGETMVATMRLKLLLAARPLCSVSRLLRTPEQRTVRGAQ